MCIIPTRKVWKEDTTALKPVRRDDRLLGDGRSAFAVGNFAHGESAIVYSSTMYLFTINPLCHLNTTKEPHTLDSQK